MLSFRCYFDYMLLDLLFIVFDIVNCSGWESGNVMVFVFSDFISYWGVYSYNDVFFVVFWLVVKFNGNVMLGVSLIVRELFISKVDEFSVSGYIFIVDILYEVVNYYGGREVDWGLVWGNYNVFNMVWKNMWVSYRSSYLGSDLVCFSGCMDDNLFDSDCINEYIFSGVIYFFFVNDL